MSSVRYAFADAPSSLPRLPRLFAIFLTPAYAPFAFAFAIAFVVMIGISLIEAIGLGLGHLDLDADVQITKYHACPTCSASSN